jgi:serine phosphatase RsbU (regulator of sigma subunit)
MDISLCQFQISDNKISKISWAGANNPLLYIENGEIQDIKPDKQPIGKTENPKPFESHLVPEKASMIILLTDGFADQFGGPKGKKYKYTRLKEFFVSIADLSIQEQKDKLQAEFENWKGDLEQVDDVCIIGIKI